MKTPITYYGGKQRIAKWILQYIPPHMTYAEPFSGLPAVLFAKELPTVSNLHYYMEVLNDIRGDVVTFYRVAKTDPDALWARIDATMYSQHAYREAREILAGADHSEIDIAWAFYILTATARAGDVTGGYRRSKAPSRNNGSTFQEKKGRLFAELKRLSEVQVDSEDALRFIELYDSPMTCFYLDPPYVGSYQGHYSGYEESDYIALLESLDSIKASFVLSGYDTGLCPDHWGVEKKDTHISAPTGENRRGVECLWFVDRSEDTPTNYTKHLWSPSGGFLHRGSSSQPELITSNIRQE